MGNPCNDVDYGNGCVPADTGYHFKGVYDGYACWWHHKNQAWNTTRETNDYHLALHFGLDPASGKVSWCHDKGATPTSLSYSTPGDFDGSNVGAWGRCAESDPNSVGFVCLHQGGLSPCSCPARPAIQDGIPESTDFWSRGYAELHFVVDFRARRTRCGYISQESAGRPWPPSQGC